MKCDKCGAEVGNGEAFCQNCGSFVSAVDGETIFSQYKSNNGAGNAQNVQSRQQKGAFCRSCGSPISPQARFCDACGAEQRIGGENDNGEQKKNNTTLITVIIAAATVIVLLAFMLIVNPFGQRDNPLETERAAVATALPTPTPSPIPTTAPTPTPVLINRISTYSPSYTYKRMNGIHSSVEASDNELNEMSGIIKDFNSAWLDYMNTGDTRVFTYLREGTEAYQNAVKYGAKDIRESYETIDVRDARSAGSDYYVWDYEVINEYSDTVTRREYHWVYRISKDEGGYYIADYTSDPAYN